MSDDRGQAAICGFKHAEGSLAVTEMAMKRTYQFGGLLAIVLGALMAVGCANNQPNAAANSNPSAKTYESQDLARTGKRTSAEALQAADPAVSARSGNQ